MTDARSPSVVTSRRALLRSGAALSLLGTAGCLRQAQNLVGRDAPEPVSLSIKTTPADDDRHSIRIARHLSANLQAAGIGASIVPMRYDELLRDLLINQDFDLYVAKHLGGHDPDFLYPLLHSRYGQEPGWQNPFGYANSETDDLLTTQRERTGEERREAVADLENAVVRDQPFTTVAFPDNVGAVRSGLATDWSADGLVTPLAYVRLPGDGTDSSDEETGEEPSTLRVTLTDGRVTENLNPLAVEFRDRGVITGLLYDSLARRYGGELRPWLATSWRFDETPTGLEATVHLRDDLRWHDGSRLTAGDVAFTYHFLADTSLGRQETSVPAPRFRGRVSLVESIEVADARTVSIRTRTDDRAVARRVFTVPILPEEEWRPLSGEANVAGIGLFDGTTEALIWNNLDPVGSGPLRFERAVYDERLALERFEDHFLDGDARGIPERFSGGFPFDRLECIVVPSSGAAVELIAAGEADVAGSPVDPDIVPAIGRAERVQLVVSGARAFYHVGFNVRRAPLGNYRFRRTVARLLDRETLVEEAFEEYARAAVSPLSGTRWASPDDEWTSDGSLTFLGSDGQVDGDQARRAFEDAGYNYDGDGRLLGHG